MSVDQNRAIDYSSFSSRTLGELQANSNHSDSFNSQFTLSSPGVLHVDTPSLKAEQYFTKSDEAPQFQSIFESYNALNEAERIQKLDHLTTAQKEYYISENVMSYLEEFVAQIRIKKLSGVLKDDGSMEMLGTNVTDMYNHAAEMAGPSSREAREKDGLDKIAQSIQAGNNRAIWISAPKIADYGFAFTFLVDDYDKKLGGKPFRELLLRYSEPLDSLRTSKSVYNTLVDRIGLPGPDSNTFATPADFLAHPLTYNLDGFEDLETLYEYLDISPEDVKLSEEFRLQVVPVIKPFLDTYNDIIQQMSQKDLQSDTSIPILEKQANDLIGGMFNMARIVYRSIKEERKDADINQLKFLQQSFPLEDTLLIAQHMAQYEPLYIQGGSNCEVTKQAGILESNFLSNVGGMGMSGAMQETGLDLLKPSKKEFDGKCVNCPSCKKTVDAIVTKEIIKCPSCKHTVKRS